MSGVEQLHPLKDEKIFHPLHLSSLHLFFFFGHGLLYFTLEPVLLVEVLFLLPHLSFSVRGVPQTCISEQMFIVKHWLCFKSTIFSNYVICVIKCLQSITLSQSVSDWFLHSGS